MSLSDLTGTVLSYQGRTRDDDDSYLLLVGDQTEQWCFADKEGNGPCWFQYQAGGHPGF